MELNKRTPDSLKAINARVLPDLCRRFYRKGLMPIEIKRLTGDILNIIGHGGFYRVNSKMVEPYRANPNVLQIFDKKDLLGSILSIH